MNFNILTAVFILSALVVTLLGHCTEASCGGCCVTCGVVPAPALPPVPAPAPVPVPAPVTYTVQVPVPVPAPVSYVPSCGFGGCGGCYGCGGCGGYGYGCGKK
ncbi:unnamed protein product [Meloidogyne enterolobii]|uniref:Uncharacterized protein n=2 Tax=Meloidogyne enterolobii TaxID=390850 RepID=A0ACB1B6J2_MELEN|nr:unnamed protein product [Meloidogyne enterolobii]